MSALGEWLRRAGLEAYEGAFAKSGVYLNVIPDLGEADMT
jgi:hypothetical protein